MVMFKEVALATSAHVFPSMLLRHWMLGAVPETAAEKVVFGTP
jgi:hypothetical protein